MRPAPLRLLDTDVVIDLQHKHPPAVAWFAGLKLSDVAVPGFVVMELRDQARNAAEARSADAIIQPLQCAKIMKRGFAGSIRRP